MILCLSSFSTPLFSIPTTGFYIPPTPMVSPGLEESASFSLRPRTVLPEMHTCFCYSYCYAKTPDESIVRKNEFPMAPVHQGRGRRGGGGVRWLVTLCLPSGSQERPTSSRSLFFSAFVQSRTLECGMVGPICSASSLSS